MSVRGSAGALLIVLLTATALGGCGGTSPATSGVFEVSSYARAAAANPVTVSPLPGTPDASPSTQISFLGAAGTTVSAVHVVGSRSGGHTGVLRAYSTGTGESFIPITPFTAGERVTVSAQVAGPAAGTRARRRFTIAHQAPIGQKEFPNNPGDAHAIQHYSTAPALTPSTVHITTPAKPGASPGDLFLAPYQGNGTPGPMIVDQGGNLVWFHPLPAGQSATNFDVQPYQGKPVLTWWQGRMLQLGFGQGEDASLRHLLPADRPRTRRQRLPRRPARVRASRPKGTAWIDAFDPVEMNLSSVHGPSAGVLTDSVVQEIDIKTGLVMWEWHALGHIPLSDSYNPVPHSYPWDYVAPQLDRPGTGGRRARVGPQHLDDRTTSTCTPARFRWRIGGFALKLQSWCAARTSTGSTTPTSSPAG